MTRRHFGSVRRRASGRWQASYWHAGKLHTGSHTFPSKADALAYLSTVEADIRRASWVDPRAGRISLSQYADKWISSRPNLRSSTLRTYGWLIDRQIKPTLGSIALSDLKPAGVREWHATLAARHPATAAKAYRLLASIYKTAVADELVVRSPCRVKGAGAERAPERPLINVEEVDLLVAAMPERLRALVQLAAWAGLRRGEMLALRRRDIDQLHRSVRIVRSAYHDPATGAISFTAPKTEAGVRTVAYPAGVSRALDAHLNQFVEPDPDALLFVGEKGGPLRLNVLYGAWHTARLAVGRPELRLHDLRHAGATWAATVGATTKELMARLGHASPQAALRYQHASEQRDRALADALTDLAAGRTVVPLPVDRAGVSVGQDGVS